MNAFITRWLLLAVTLGVTCSAAFAGGSNYKHFDVAVYCGSTRCAR